MLKIGGSEAKLDPVTEGIEHASPGEVILEGMEDV